MGSSCLPFSAPCNWFLSNREAPTSSIYMLTGQPHVNATYGPLQWPFGPTSEGVASSGTRSQSVTSLKLGANAERGVDIPNPTAMLHINTDHLSMAQSSSPSCSPRPILGCNDWNLPSVRSSLRNTGQTISPSGSDGSYSSVDVSDLMSSLSISPPQRLLTTPTEQEMANLRALHSLTFGPMMHSAPALSPTPQFFSPLGGNNRTWSVSDMDYNRMFKFNRAQSTSSLGGQLSWTGELPSRMILNPTYSCKVFLGGIPWDITEEFLVLMFVSFGIGRVRVEWPGKEGSTIQPRGYVYIIFESESQVKLLLSSCNRDVSSNYENYYFKLYSKKMKSKLVQVIPWRLSDSNYVVTPSEKLDPTTTVFVGGLHGMLNAEGLYRIMNDLFGGVMYVGIDTDKFKYPIGSARVTFDNRRSYTEAVMAAFVEVKTSKFVKRVQIDPYLEDSVCSVCILHPGPYFCRELSCFRYYCQECWMQQHQFFRSHKPLVRTSKYNGSNATPHSRNVLH